MRKYHNWPSLVKYSLLNKRIKMGDYAFLKFLQDLKQWNVSLYAEARYYTQYSLDFSGSEDMLEAISSATLFPV